MKKAKEKKHEDRNIVQVIQIFFIILLCAANGYGLFYCYTIFTAITQTQEQNVIPIASKVVTPFNETLYEQVQKDRQDRLLYSSSSPTPHFTFRDIFSPSK